MHLLKHKAEQKQNETSNVPRHSHIDMHRDYVKLLNQNLFELEMCAFESF